jgi:hypothetical protein
VLSVVGTPNSPEVKERSGKLGVEVVADTPEHFAQFLKAD